MHFFNAEILHAKFVHVAPNAIIQPLSPSIEFSRKDPEARLRLWPVSIRLQRIAPKLPNISGARRSAWHSQSCL